MKSRRAGLKLWWLLFAIASLSLLEIATTLIASKYFGAALTCAVFAASTLLGLLVQWRRWPRTKALLKQSASGLEVYRDDQNKLTRPEVFDPAAAWVLFWVGCLLFLIPGFATDIIAWALMLPTVQNRVLARAFDTLKPRLPKL